MKIITFVLLGFAALPLALFVYYYNRYSPLWRKTLQGRTLMAQKIAMLAVLVNTIVSIAFDYPAEHAVGLVLFTLLAVLFWTMFVALRLAQRPPNKRKKE